MSERSSHSGYQVPHCLKSQSLPRPTTPNGLSNNPHKHPTAPQPVICPNLNRTGALSTVQCTNNPSTDTEPGILLPTARPPPRTPPPNLHSRPLPRPLTLSHIFPRSRRPRHQ